MDIKEAFYTLHGAIDSMKDNEHVLACDTQLDYVDNEGRHINRVGKKFMTCPNIQQGGLAYFQRLVNVHGPHFYEILLPDRASKIFVDIETTNGVYEKVKQGVETFVKMLQMWVESQGGIVDNFPFRILDSSNEKKASFHVVGGPYLKNPYHVGALIRRLTLFIYSARYEETQQKFDFESFFDNDGNYIIDEQIYTHNRQFRLCNMCKLSPNPRYLKGCTTPESIVQIIDSVYNMTCLEIDETEPMSTSKKATDIFTMADDSWVRVISISNSMKGIRATLPDSLLKIRTWIEVWMGHGKITGTTFDVRNGYYKFTTSCKKCQSAKRFHKSNHTYVILNPWQRLVHQKCFDENCTRAEFKIPVPDELWLTWSQYMSKNIHITTVKASC